MNLDVVELFARCRWFRANLNNIHFNKKTGKAIEKMVGILYGQINMKYLQKPSMLLNAIGEISGW